VNDKNDKKLLRKRLNQAREHVVQAQQLIYEIQHQVGVDKGKDLELPLSSLQRVLATVHLVAEREGVKIKVKKEKI
jgi:hypothetical protein